MDYQFEFRPYQRRFVRSLSTSHGNWDIREGIILCLTNANGQIGWGEIAPLPWFGSETLAQALEFCDRLPAKITATDIFSIPNTLPACQFGFESAWEMISNLLASKLYFFNAKYAEDSAEVRKVFPNSEAIGKDMKSNLHFQSKIAYSGLLPAGEAALQVWQPLWHQGYRTFKWKVGVAAITEEIKIFARLIQALPNTAKLRLDANGGLNRSKANEWLRVCENWSSIEFLEQPLPVTQFDAMLDLCHRYSTPLALDESVATLEELETCTRRGWRGIFVIKPAIIGSPKKLRQFCKQHQIDAVFSSVFETIIGRQAAIELATELSKSDRAVGFGIEHWFIENDETWLETLWNL